MKGSGSCLLGWKWVKYIRIDWKSIASLAMNEGHHRLGRVLQTYESVFKEDLGMLKSATATLHVKPNATPKFFKPRPVPYAIREYWKMSLID